MLARQLSTRRPDTEAALSDEQFRRMAGGLSVVIWRMNADGTNVVAPRWAELTGRREQELQRRGWIETLHEDDRAVVAKALSNALVYGTHVEADFRLRFRDGSYHWFRARGEPARSERGDVVGWLGIASNIDDQKRAEQALVDNEARLRTIIEAARVGTINHDLTTGTLQVGPMALRMLGLPETTRFTFEMLGECIHPDDREPFARAVARATDPAGNGELEAVFRVIHPDGSVVWLSSRGTYQFQGTGTERRAVRFVGVCSDLTAHMQDITRQKQLEAELAQAQKMEAVGRLAGGVAHDLNNILTAILGGIEIARVSTPLDSEAAKEFKEVRAECFRAAGLIRQLLAVGKKQVIHPRPCDINEIVGEINPMLSRLLGEDMTLATNTSATHGIFADPAQIGQVLLNLAVNARDAMPKGGILSIETADDDKTRSVVIRVRDTGTGMTPEVKARLFEPFFTTKPVGTGTGLGLSTSYGIIAQSGGAMDVASEVGAGTTFTISLPATDARTVAESEPALSTAVRGSETILLVEDNRLVRDNLVRGLSRAGYHVLEARDGLDALAVLEHHNAPIHLVITDVVMPEMNGVDLVTRLRSWFPRLRVLFMSGYSVHAVEKFGVIADDTELLQKPFEIAHLAERVRASLDAHRASSHAA